MVGNSYLWVMISVDWKYHLCTVMMEWKEENTGKVVLEERTFEMRNIYAIDEFARGEFFPEDHPRVRVHTFQESFVIRGRKERMMEMWKRHKQEYPVVLSTTES